MLWGGDIGDVDVVLAGQFRQNSRLGWDERDLLANSGLTISSNAPGNWYTPDRGADGLYTGSRSRTPDPACAPASARTSYTPDQIANKMATDSEQAVSSTSVTTDPIVSPLRPLSSMRTRLGM